jgi:hypothetical protein
MCIISINRSKSEQRRSFKSRRHKEGVSKAEGTKKEFQKQKAQK